MEKRALVVEPSRDLRELISEILHAQQFDVDAVADASRIRDADRYAVVIADVPFGEVAARYADKLHTKHLVLMSACPEDLDEVRSEIPSLVKPFDRRSLVAAVKRVSA